MRPLLYLDTNVFLDFFLARRPYGEDAARILHLAATDQLVASTSALSMTNVAFTLGCLDHERNIEHDIIDLLQIIEIIPNTAEDMEEAINAPLEDFEDSMQYQSALRGQCNYLVTANKHRFRNCRIAALDPSEFMLLFGHLHK